ncbi:MAG: bifunctional phosphopantothenoylcysteine decarboxylase/phosphopantothenate--cysteine ligase CoaBC [Gammaproteobacteria bacterium]|nr:bifunctional phosphopantothenoylcysteine decarboxylase/phosphopantothenate--cysteine ligase CoaBC [Gammaproteobacteria bacterium]MCW5582352.1 bifunctional phosphopantothenoylcysteine decarboxylase/phosphopantothenate--cysteine ligase CoaBC [Gammaproteobacteria bacterium]
MALFLANKRILLGVTGSIAAYKSPEIVRRLRESGAVVRVAMTENAQRFITPLTMQAVSGYPVHQELFDLQAEAAMGHIELARWADVVLVAPATADFMARLANGNADDLLTTVCLATKAPLMIAPAMNQGMWQHVLTQENLQILQRKRIQVVGPSEGSQACGDIGPGRMIEPVEILEKLSGLFAHGGMAGLRVLVTAGPTHEAIDPVRFISNGSSGKMGYALAEAAHEAGAIVTLISGPVVIREPEQIECVHVITANEMYDAVMRKIIDCDIFLAVAAVGDYRSKTIAKQKIHKDQAAMLLELERNPDIVGSVGKLSPKPFIVGFAAETENLLEQAEAKRKRKNMDMIVANRVDTKVGMGTDDNEVMVLGEKRVSLPLMPKQKLARELIMMIASAYQAKQ